MTMEPPSHGHPETGFPGMRVPHSCRHRLTYPFLDGSISPHICPMIFGNIYPNYSIIISPWYIHYNTIISSFYIKYYIQLLYQHYTNYHYSNHIYIYIYISSFTVLDSYHDDIYIHHHKKYPFIHFYHHYINYRHHKMSITILKPPCGGFLNHPF